MVELTTYVFDPTQLDSVRADTLMVCIRFVCAH